MRFIILIFFLINISKTRAQVNLTQGLVGCYSFNGNANDGSGNNNNGVVYNATLTLDRFGNTNSAYHFNGSNAYIDIAANTNNFLNYTYSYSLWGKLLTVPSNGNYTYYMGVGGPGGDLGFDVSNTGQGVSGIIFSQYNVGTPLQSIVGNNNFPAIGQWVHFVVVRDSSLMKLYINGVLNTYIMTFNGGYNANTYNTAPSYGNSPKFTIGARSNVSQFMNADIDDVCAYNRPLNQQEVTALYNNLTITQLSVSSPDTVICQGQSTTLTANGGGIYSWSPSIGLNSTGSQTVIASPNITTTYTVNSIPIGSCNCGSVAGGNKSITIYVKNKPNVFAGNDTVLCAGDSLNLNGTGGYAYNWNPSTYLSNANINNPVFSSSVSMAYVLTASDSFCSNTDTIFLSIANALNLSIGNDTLLCIGDSLQLHAPLGFQTYTWSPAVGLNNNNIANPIASPNTNTTYTLTASILGCVSQDSINISTQTKPLALAGNDTTLCEGSLLTLSGSGGNNYYWSPSSNLSNANISNPIFNGNNNITYTLTVSNNYCSNVDTININIIHPPILDAGNDTSICDNSHIGIQLNASGGFQSYLWTPSTGLSNNNIYDPIASPTSNTNYILTATYSGCVIKDSVNISLDVTPIAFAGNDTSICFGTSVQLNASGGTNYYWSPSSNLNYANIYNPIATPNISTNYIVTISNNYCKDRDSLFINVWGVLNPDSNFDTTINYGSSVHLNMQNGFNYNWTPSTGLSCHDCPNPIATPEETTHYIITKTDSNGCSNSDSITIYVNDDYGLYIPNAVSLNGFNKNFIIYGYGITNYILNIYDKWGELIFKQNYTMSDLNVNGWDCKVKGNSVQTDVYVWTLNYTTKSGILDKKMGRLTVIK